MQRGRTGPSLGERAESSGIVPAGGRTDLPADPRRVPPSGAPVAGRLPGSRDGAEGRHCWVRDPPDAPGTWPGLLVEWRQRAGAWEGRVAYGVTGPHGTVLVEAWLPADRLQPR